MEVDAHQVDVGHGQCPATHLRQVLGWDARLVDLDSQIDGDGELREVVPPPQVGYRRLDAKPYLGGAARRGGSLLDEVDLADVLHGDAYAGFDASQDVLGRLATAVDRDAGGVDAAPQNPVELLRRVDVGAGAFVAEDPPDRQQRVRLHRRQHVDRAVPTAGKRVAEPAHVGPELMLGEHEQRRPETLRQFHGVASFDEEATRSDGEAVGLSYGPVPVGAGGGGTPHATSSSFATVDGTW